MWVGIKLAVSLSGNLQSCLRTVWLLLSKSTGKSEPQKWINFTSWLSLDNWENSWWRLVP